MVPPQSSSLITTSKTFFTVVLARPTRKKAEILPAKNGYWQDAFHYFRRKRGGR
jgi:hypothetical protein